LLSEGGQALSSLTEQVVLRLQQLVRRDTKKGFFRPCLMHISTSKAWPMPSSAVMVSYRNEKNQQKHLFSNET